MDTNNIVEAFTSDGLHRMSLHIPFLDRQGGRNLCVIGQNPSKANRHVADRTVLYLEKYISRNLPQYSSFTMLNLYTRVDTDKTIAADLRRFGCDRHALRIIQANQDFLIVVGKLKKEGVYDFPLRARAIKRALTKNNRNVYRFDIGTTYAPHPRNQKIGLGKLDIGLTDHTFGDIR